MTITSLTFALFALASAIAVNAAQRLPWPRARSLMMLACNLWFFASFATGGLMQLVPMVGFMALGLLVTRVLRVSSAGRHYAALLGLTLLAFFWLKKYAFVPQPLWIASPYVTLGLSYILFRVLQIIIDLPG